MGHPDLERLKPIKQDCLICFVQCLTNQHRIKLKRVYKGFIGFEARRTVKNRQKSINILSKSGLFSLP
jgi:hypothetical protein